MTETSSLSVREIKKLDHENLLGNNKKFDLKTFFFLVSVGGGLPLLNMLLIFTRSELFC